MAGVHSWVNGTRRASARGAIHAKNITRVEAHTSHRVNKAIRDEAKARVAHLARHPELIPNRLRELEREWDIERALETGSATFSLTGLALGILHSRRWLILPIAVQSFFLQHALQGWCPPLPLFRRMGFRTMREIMEEREALEDILEEEGDAEDSDVTDEAPRQHRFNRRRRG